MSNEEKKQNMWYNITGKLDVKTCLDLNIYIQGEQKKAQKELLEDYKNTLEHLSYKLMENNTVSPYIDRKLEELKLL